MLAEPTGNVDARNEARFQRLLGIERRHMTMIIVAPRLSTVVNADQIVVVDRGTVIAHGRQDELVPEVGLYQDLVQQQLLAN